MERKRFDTSVDFLPNSEGRIWVDACGLQWVCRKRLRGCNGTKVASIERMSNFASALKIRGNYLTTEGGSAEIFHNFVHYTKFGEGISGALARGEGCYCPKKGVKIRATKRMEDIYFSRAEAFGRTSMILEEGIELYSPERVQLDPDFVREDVEGIISEHNIKVSNVDKEIVVAAISAGNGNGVLSADGGLIDVFERAVEHFERKRCFVCSPIRRRTYFVSSKKGCRRSR